MANIELPISRVVDVTIDRQTIFPTRDGFGTLLIVTGDATGPLDATTRTKLYASADEVAEDYASTTETYKAAQQAFSVSPAPLFIKIGWRDIANPIADELDEINEYDDDWYGLAFTKEVRDHYQIGAVDQIPLVAAWIEARVKVFMTASNDVLTEDVADATNISAVLHLAGYDRTATFYHTNADLYPDVAFLARGLRVNFNGRNTTETNKFKRLQGISTLQKSSAKITAITGFVPGQGQIDNQGHFANTYVNIAGREMIVEGNMISGEWFDTIHFVDWLQNAISVRILSLLVSTPKIPYTDQGIQKIVDEVTFALEEGIRNGGLAQVYDEESGTYKPEYEIEVPRVSTVPISQRANRIAPTIQFKARLAGAVHYAVVNGTVTV